MTEFILGMLIGSVIGITVMSCLSIIGSGDDDE